MSAYEVNGQQIVARDPQAAIAQWDATYRTSPLDAIVCKLLIEGTGQGLISGQGGEVVQFIRSEACQ